jgi:hypothetical protein
MSLEDTAREISDDLNRALTRMNESYNAHLRERDGTAQQCMWECEDKWIVVYTTTRIRGGNHHGAFAAQLFKPNPKRKDEWVQVDRRVCSTRREAKARAVKWYYQHSPKAAKRHGVTS